MTVLEEIVIMGKIVAPHGIKGWLKIQTCTEKKETLGNFKIWNISYDQKKWDRYEVDNFQIKENFILAKLSNVNDRNLAEEFSKAFIGVYKKDLPTLESSQFYWFQLIGLEVVNLEGHIFGQVQSILETGANDVLVINGLKEKLVPYIDDVIMEIDLEAKLIKVDWPDDF